jgi:cytochrome P450
MNVGLWTRWLGTHGVARMFMRVQARRGDPFAQLLAGHGRGIDPYPLFEELRAGGPLVRATFNWVTVDYALCREILRDKRFGVTAPSRMDMPRRLRKLISGTDDNGVANPTQPPAMLVVDPPEHTRYRQLVSQSFTPRAIEKLATRVTEVTDHLIERLADTPNPDLIRDFASQLAVAVIAEILDLPPETQPRMLEWGQSGTPLLDLGIGWRTYRSAIDTLRVADRELRERFHHLRSGGEMGDHPFSRLAVHGKLTEHEFTANAALLIGAGFETTVNLIGNGINLLLQHPDQLARLRNDPELWPSAVDEVLRIDGPVQMTARTAYSDVDLAGHRIAAGEMVAVLLGGANRDPQVFADPHKFDITRPNARDHLTFSSGIHACIGAALARVEGATALRALFEAFPDLELAGPPQSRGLVNLRGFSRLPARLGTRSAASLRP